MVHYQFVPGRGLRGQNSQPCSVPCYSVMTPCEKGYFPLGRDNWYTGTAFKKGRLNLSIFRNGEKGFGLHYYPLRPGERTKVSAVRVVWPRDSGVGFTHYALSPAWEFCPGEFQVLAGGAKKRHLFRGFPFRAGELIADLPSGTACKTGRQTQLLLSLKRARYSDVEAFSRTVSLRSNPGQRA